MNIKSKGMLFSFIMILVATLIIGTSAYVRFKEILVQEVYTAVVRVAEESADHLNNYIQQYETPLIGLSENEDIRSMNLEKQRSVLKAQINPQYLNIAVVNMQGFAQYSDNTVINLYDRDYVKKALEGKISFSDIIISRKTGDPVIMMGVPIYRDNTVVGGLIARLDVGFLQKYASTRGYEQNGRAYVITENGVLISKPKPDNHKQLYNLYDIAAVDSNYTSFAEFVKSSNDKKSGYGQYIFGHENIIMGYASIEKTNWKVYIGTYEEDILKSLNGLKQLFMVLGIITIIVCTTGAWILVARFTKPIVELDQLFAKGEKGDLTIRFSPKTKDEIGRLGISFNRMMDKIKTLTQYDPLTGLLNPFVLEKDVDNLVSSDVANNFTLVMAAIDRLNFINDTYGYPVGDAILMEVANRISNYSSSLNKIYRYKGDEFVLLYHEFKEEDEIQKVAKSLMDDLSKSFQINGKTIDVNISIGIFINSDDTREKDPLNAVTMAKNSAKSKGLYQVQNFDKQTHDKMKISRELQADIINGLKQNQFFLVYQPLFELDNGKIAELEALIRWNHPEKGILYPDKFIDLAEASGAIINIDKWVLESACELLNSWKEKGKPRILLSVNISSLTFEMTDFVPYLMSVIKGFGTDPSTLQLEITERMLINNVEECIRKLNELRSMGIRVAIDDFGIGYSSLSYIVRLPVDSIKIDKIFVQNISSSKEAKAIVATIINLCKTLNLNVIAEGIEKKTELDYLKSNHCDIGQGYYFSKPISLTEIEKNHF